MPRRDFFGTRADGTLGETLPGAPQREGHKRRCQGAAAVHEQVAYGVGNRVRADEELLEDRPVGADSDSQGEHRLEYADLHRP